ESLLGRTDRITGCWLVLGGDAPLRDAVAAGLLGAGAVPVAVEHGGAFQRLGGARYQIRPAVADDFVVLAGRLQAAGPPIAGVIALWATEATDGGRRAYDGLVALAEGLTRAASGTPVRVIVASAGSASVLDEPVLRPAAAVALGPVLVLPTEVPALRLRYVDLKVDLDRCGGTVDPAAAGRALIAEAGSPDTELLVAWRCGRRFVRRFERLNLPAADAADWPLRSGGVYLITGGLGGIGL